MHTAFFKVMVQLFSISEIGNEISHSFIVHFALLYGQYSTYYTETTVSLVILSVWIMVSCILP